MKYDVEIDGELLNNFNTIMNNLDKINNNYFIIIDDYERFKNAEVAEWYEKIDKSNGIWIGEGIKEQDVFVVNDVVRTGNYSVTQQLAADLQINTSFYVITRTARENRGKPF